MQTKTLIQAQANVIRITSLAKGNVVKILDDSAYGDNKIKYGIVVDLMNDGTKTFIEMLEYSKSYSQVSAEIKLYSGEKEVSFFPTTVEEVQQYFNDSIKSLEKSLESKKEEVFKLQEGLEKAKAFASGEMSRELTSVSYEELPQTTYEQKRLEKQKALEQIESETF